MDSKQLLLEALRLPEEERASAGELPLEAPGAKLDTLSAEEVTRRQRAADLSFQARGITFAVNQDPSGLEKIMPFDLVPRIILPEEWQRIETKLREQSIFNPEVRELSRLYISRAKDVTLDAAGRVLIPPDVRDQAGLSKEVTLVGGGLPQFEVWDRSRFEEYERTRQDRLPSLFERLSSLGV